MDAGDESVVDLTHPIGREEKKSLEVFHASKESYLMTLPSVLQYQKIRGCNFTCYQSVPCQILVLSSLQENVCFIDK